MILWGSKPPSGYSEVMLDLICEDRSGKIRGNYYYGEKLVSNWAISESELCLLFVVIVLFWDVIFGK